jgi:putative phage-type endonuclease
MIRPFSIVTAEQRSAEWFAARAGRVTASRAADILATIKSGEAAARRNYRIQLVAERLTGAPQDDGFVSAAMLRGTELEPQARTAYELLTGQMVKTVGFLAHTELPIGASPDGVIGDFDGLLELKCPNPATHVGYLKAGKVPSDYLPQLTHQLLVSGAPYVDFMSYVPNLPEHLQTFLVRVQRSDVGMEAYEAALRTFLREVDDEVRALQTMANPLAQFKAAVEAVA